MEKGLSLGLHTKNEQENTELDLWTLLSAI